MSLAIISWNVNGLAPCLRRLKVRNVAGLLKTLSDHVGYAGCVFGFQEIKLRPQELTRNIAVIPEYESYFSLCDIPRLAGYSGVGLYVRRDFQEFLRSTALTDEGNEGDVFGESLNPAKVCPTREGGNRFMQGPDFAMFGLSWAFDLYVEKHEDHGLTAILPFIKQFDKEGRLISLFFVERKMAIINLYFVARRDESRVSIREAGKRGLEVLLSEIVEGMKYDVILMGDLNMVFSPNDTVDPSKVTNDEFLESLFNRFELVDTFSYFHPDAVRAFTCWNQLSGARLTNYGSRIDYILASRTLTAKFLIDSQVLQQQQGSDHCPVALILRKNFFSYSPMYTLIPECAHNWPQMQQRQQVISSWVVPLSPSLSRDEFVDADTPKHEEALSAVSQEQSSPLRLQSASASPLFLSRDACPRDLDSPSSDCICLSSPESTGAKRKFVQASLSDLFKRSKRQDACEIDLLSKEGDTDSRDAKEPLHQEAATVVKTADQPNLSPSPIPSVPRQWKEVNALDTLGSARRKLPPDDVARMKNAVSYLSTKEQTLYFALADEAPLCLQHKYSYTTAHSLIFCSDRRLPCILRMTKKKGENFGRRFWSCCYPSGDPSSAKSRCDYFKWKDHRHLRK